METIGGPGKQFWVNGRNYGLEGLSDNKLKEAHEWAGEWRTEIMPPIPSCEDHFLHVLAVSDKNDTPPPITKSVEEGVLKGTVVCGHAVLFNCSEEPITSISYNLPDFRLFTHIIIGVKPSTRFAMYESSRIIATAVSTEGGSVRFSVPTDAKGPFSISEN